MGSIKKEVAIDIAPFVRILKDGSVERLMGSPIVPPSSPDPQTGVSSKDITISQEPPISARLYLPDLTQFITHHQLPILVYFHGGGFCIGSAFSMNETKYMNCLVSQAKVVTISVDYRLAPENPLPIAYEDCWAALKWVASHSVENCSHKEPWISNHGDLGRLFIGGDSAGANIAHNLAIRANTEALPGDVKLLGAYLTHPYFWGSKPVGSESTAEHKKGPNYMIWVVAYPSATGGIDNPMINPVAPGAPSLGGLGCSRLLVIVAEKDSLRERGVLYYNSVKESGWKGQVDFIQVQGEGHAFHILNSVERQSARNLIKQLAYFLND